ncbi:MAG: N-acetyltransferase family protein [Gemmatimonadota bacterium]
MIDIVTADPGRVDELSAFFDRNDPGCFCMWPRCPPMRFEPADPANREAMRQLVASGGRPGLLALRDGRTVGWCAVAPQSEYPQYADPEPGRWGIACVLVDPSVRGEGVARALVEAAVVYAAEHGAETIDGPPPWWRPREERQAAALVRVLVECGFEKVGEGARMPVLRKEVALAR